MSSDKDFMAMALDLARLGLGRTSPNPAVGCVIVKNGRVIGRGSHKGPGRPHAEVEARKERGATMYVTLEPCCPPKPGGRTPPCTDAIIKSGIHEVVVGMRDPDPRVSGKGIRLLRRNGIRVRVGILQAECERLNEAYVKHRKTGMPFVTLKIASTLDGMVASKSGKPFDKAQGRPRWITGPEARAFGHRLRDRADGILVGINTIEKDNPRLTTRLKGRNGRDPVRIILDSSLRIRPEARVLRVRSPSPTWIATVVRPSHPKVRRLQRLGVEILLCKRSPDGRVDLKDLLKKLGRLGLLNLLVEGGPQTWSSFLSQGLFDRILLFLAPVFGPVRFREMNSRWVGGDLMIEGSLVPKK